MRWTYFSKWIIYIYDKEVSKHHLLGYFWTKILFCRITWRPQNVTLIVIFDRLFNILQFKRLYHQLALANLFSNVYPENKNAKFSYFVMKISNIYHQLALANVFSNDNPENINANSSYSYDENIKYTIPNTKWSMSCNKYTFLNGKGPKCLIPIKMGTQLFQMCD